MFNDQLAKLEKAKADVQQLEAKISAERVAALAKLPSDFGYASLADFIKAVSAAAKGGAKTKGAGRKASEPKTPKAAKGPKGTRARITDEIKAQVKSLAEAGKTGQEIAKELGISAPSVQNIKKALGLVKSRTAVEAPAAVAAPELAVEAPAAEVAVA